MRWISSSSASRLTCSVQPGTLVSSTDRNPARTMPSSASSRLYEWYVFVDAARRSAIVSNLQVDAARWPLLVEPGASGLDLHVLDEDTILPGEGNARERWVTDIERRKVDVFPFQVGL